MNRIRKSLIPTLLLVLLGLIPLASSQGSMPPGHHEIPHRPDPDYRHHFGDRNFEGMSENFNVTGTIHINNGIILSISVSPTSDMVDKRMSQATEHGFYPNISTFENTMSVNLSRLIEFEDTTGDGFTDDDTIMSLYSLNDINLNDVQNEVVDGLDTYTITSTDSVFTMIIEVNSTNDLPHDWKWSLVIEYPFSSSTSSLAMIHRITALRSGNLMKPYPKHSFSNHSLLNNDSAIPMRFAWDSTASVDGNEEDITATTDGSIFALSIIQGDLIDYDPSIGLNPQVIDDIENELYQLTHTKDFVDTVNSPTFKGLLIGALLVTVTITISYVVRRKNET
ncbi:MAG: hypothetical protein ACXAD7_01260 [Candidatus Kariarchaeaceae archaeon]|jgi:hypothetical protein